jgi:hypothetical protein
VSVPLTPAERIRNCRHARVTLVGSDETGCRSARCTDCGEPMARTRSEDGLDWIYVSRAIVDRLRAEEQGR